MSIAPSLPRPTALAAGVVGAAAAAWIAIVTITRTMGMGGGTAADVAAFLGAWLVMMAAMMLPSALPMLLLYHRAARARAHTPLFASGYLGVWTLYGAIAYAVYALLEGKLVSMGDLDALGRPAAAAALGAAALYQLSPLKQVCLRHCRSPLAFVMQHWRPGARGAVRMGAVHGAWCVGCCTGLMVTLFALGVMNLVWMVAVALAILAEKVVPYGVWLSRMTGGTLAALAIAVAASGEVAARLT